MYAKIFVFGPNSIEELVGALEAGIGVEAELGGMTMGGGTEVDVVKNDDFDPGKADSGTGDFLFFPYYLDVEDDEPDGRPLLRPPLVSAVNELLEVLSEAGFTYVVAADFEDLLPRRGDSRGAIDST